jgi:small subunit ribosomal protein S2
MTEVVKTEKALEELFKAGAHFGFVKGRRHPSVSPYIFGSKNKVDIFDLEKTQEGLAKASEFVTKLGETKAPILFVGGKNEAQNIVRDIADKIDMPYCAGRWVGGTLTNFGEIRKRVEMMLNLISQKEKGELVKYTKKERLLIGKKIEKLQKMYWGIKDMSALPKALFIVDPRYEETALKEAQGLNIPVIALCGSDNNISEVDFPITANDSNIASIRYFVDKIAESYSKGKKE